MDYIEEVVEPVKDFGSGDKVAFIHHAEAFLLVGHVQILNNRSNMNNAPFQPQ